MWADNMLAPTQTTFYKRGKTRLPKLVMPSFCERSEAKAATLQVEAITAEP